MSRPTLKQLTPAGAIFDPEDRFARDRAVRGKHPRPMGGLRYSLLGRIVGGSRQDFDSPMELMVVRNAGGYDIFFENIKLATGSRFRHILEEGIYVLRIESDFYQIIERDDVALPQSTQPISLDLEPGYNYPFPASTLANSGGPTLLRGSLHKISGEVRAGVRIEVAGRSNSYVTDEAGQWVLVFIENDPGGPATVRFTYGDGSHEDVPNVPIEPGAGNRLFQAGLKGAVLDAAGLGIAGASVQVQGYDGATNTDEEGVWYYYFGLNQGADVVNVTARRQDGSTLTQSNVQVQPHEVVVVPSFRFT